MRFDNRVVLVTGGAAGIGRGIAEQFAEEGARVAVFDIDAEGAGAVAAAFGERGLAVHGDVAREEDAANAVARTVARFGGIDILVNNAGIVVRATVPELAPEQWDRQMGVNLRAVYMLSHLVIPHMRGRGGVIVNISSVHAFHSYAGCAAYDASKAALIGLTRTMALDHGREGVRVVAICPGYIDTPLLEQWFRAVPDPEAAMRQVLAVHPCGRIGRPRDIAEACLFLASDAASFITGTALVVDGGMTTAGH